MLFRVIHWKKESCCLNERCSLCKDCKTFIEILFIQAVQFDSIGMKFHRKKQMNFGNLTKIY